MSDEPSKPVETEQENIFKQMEDKKKQLRETAKWILTGFGAIAAALLAGINLSSISKVSLPYLYFAMISFLVALTAVFLEIYLVSQVLTCGSMNQQQMRRFVNDRQVQKINNLNSILLLDGYLTVDKFFDDYDEKGARFETARKEKDFKTLGEMNQEMKRMVQTYFNLKDQISFTSVKFTYKKAIQGIFIFGAIAALAIAVFAWSVGKTPAAVTVFANPPAAAQLTLTEAGQQALAPSLGEKCVTQPAVAVILLSVEGGSFDVVSQPTADCAVVRFKVSADVGQVKTQP